MGMFLIFGPRNEFLVIPNKIYECPSYLCVSRRCYLPLGNCSAQSWWEEGPYGSPPCRAGGCPQLWQLPRAALLAAQLLASALLCHTARTQIPLSLGFPITGADVAGEDSGLLHLRFIAGMAES